MPIIVYFDGKIITDFTGPVDETKYRLSVLIKRLGESQLLCVPGLAHGTGEAQFEVIYWLLNSYDICEWICRICFDTTASNTGRVRGACTSVDHFHDRPLLMLAYRHHSGEIHISHFNSKVAGNRLVGPEN